MERNFEAEFDLKDFKFEYVDGSKVEVPYGIGVFRTAEDVEHSQYIELTHKDYGTFNICYDIVFTHGFWEAYYDRIYLTKSSKAGISEDDAYNLLFGYIKEIGWEIEWQLKKTSKEITDDDNNNEDEE